MQTHNGGRVRLTSLRVLLFTLCGALGSWNAGASSGKLAPDLDLETVQTEHFRIHYPGTHRLFTSHLITHLEEAHHQLTQDLQWRPQRRIEVLVRSDVDQPNGYAQVFPFNRMVVHAVPFQTHSFIGEYDHWIRTLVYHELTHVIANDTTTGFFDVMRSIFGSSAKMNPFQPQWLVEGLAVYMETFRGTYGRGRSHWVDMHLRTAAAAGLLQAEGASTPISTADAFRVSEEDRQLLKVTLDRLNGGPPLWPGANTPYVYGYLINELIAARKGKLAPGELSRKTSGRLPFLVNKTARLVVGEDYRTLWPEVLKRISEATRSDLQSLERVPFSKAERLTDRGRFTGGGAHRNGSTKIHFLSDSHQDGLGISELDLVTRRETRLAHWRSGGGSRLRTDPEGRALFYSRYDDYREFRTYSEVFAWDLARAKEVQLTNGLRAIDPDPSPDLRWDSDDGRISQGSLVYVKNLRDGNQGIVTFDGEHETLLHRGHEFERLSYPVWGKGATKGWIFFASKMNDGPERIAAIGTNRGPFRWITPWSDSAARSNQTTPDIAADGTLLFSSSEGGVYNIWSVNAEPLAAHLDTEGEAFPSARRITHVATGAFFPLHAGRSDEVFALLYGPKGFDLSRIRTGEHEAGTLIARTVEEKIQGVDSSQAPASVQPPLEPFVPEEKDAKGRPYSVFPALLPQYWVPDLRIVPDGYQAALLTSGMDAVDRHRYDLLLGLDSRANFPVYQVHYEYDGFYPTIQLEANRDNRYLSLYQESNRADRFNAWAMVPIRRHWVGLGGMLAESKFFDQVSESGGFVLRYFHANFRKAPDSIDAQGDWGYRFDVNLLNSFVSDQRYSSIEATAEQRIPSPIDRHFFRFVQSYGASNNEDISANYYVGGGQATLTQTQPFLLRGYQAGSIFGRKIVTLNGEYWMPVFDLFRGSGTLPAFLERTKLRSFVDVGSAEFVALDRRRMSQWPLSAGAHLLSDLTLFYRVPVTVGVGFDWGFRRELGGQKQVVLGIYSRFL